jgi:preprotein translocase subunit SecB
MRLSARRMNENIIQKKIRLLSFKAIKFNFEITQKGKEKAKTLFDVSLSDILIQDQPNWFVKVFNIKLITDMKSEKLEINLEYHTVFDCSEPLGPEFLKSDFATISAPSIGFPYVRSFISSLTVQAGIPPIILPSINFVQFKKAQEKSNNPQPPENR